MIWVAFGFGIFLGMMAGIFLIGAFQLSSESDRKATQIFKEGVNENYYN